MAEIWSTWIWPSLLEAWLALISVHYHRNVAHISWPMVSGNHASSNSGLFALEIARFLWVFGINTAGDISKFIKISRVIFGEFWNNTSRYLSQTPRRNRAVSLFILQGRHFALDVTGVIFSCKYFIFGLNTTVLSKSHFTNLSACSIKYQIFTEQPWTAFSLVKSHGYDLL